MGLLTFEFVATANRRQLNNEEAQRDLTPGTNDRAPTRSLCHLDAGGGAARGREAAASLAERAVVHLHPAREAAPGRRARAVTDVGDPQTRIGPGGNAAKTLRRRVEAAALPAAAELAVSVLSFTPDRDVAEAATGGGERTVLQP